MISLLVPFTAPKRSLRAANWAWIEQRWRMVLPEAELVVGIDTGKPYSKSAAVNDAYRRSKGDILVVCDADTWMERADVMTLLDSASKFPQAVVGWQTCYRMSKENSAIIRKTDPAGPLPVNRDMINAGGDEGTPSPESIAMIFAIQRSSFEQVGGMDPRFRGWGGEDTSFGLACWTLLGPTALTNGTCYSLWHARPRVTGQDIRVWDHDSGNMNQELWERYRDALNLPAAMTALCAEHSLGFPVGLQARAIDSDDTIRFRQGAGLEEGETVRLW